MSTHVKCQEIVCYLHLIMNKKTVLSVLVLMVVLFSIWNYSDSKTENEVNSEHIKVAFRDVGHQLLLSYQDSTSLVLPIIEIKNMVYQLSFQRELAFEPGNLVAIIDEKIKKAVLSSNYIVEVKDCSSKKVVYSFEVHNSEEKNIIPCIGRILPKNCYLIEVHFTSAKAEFVWENILYGTAIVLFLLFQFIFNKRREAADTEKLVTKNHTSLGSFKFYPEQNKLVKEAVEISLSKKECELLAIFIANPNQIIKREELMKRVWEDHGVIVGRSLDTYISKLRKKLKEDISIKITNVHGVGYKLELD